MIRSWLSFYAQRIIPPPARLVLRLCYSPTEQEGGEDNRSCDGKVEYGAEAGVHEGWTDIVSEAFFILAGRREVGG